MAVDQAGGQIGQRLHGEGRLGHAGDLLLDQVELADRAAELLAGAGALDGQLQRALGAADAAGTERAAAVIEHAQRDLQSLAELPEDAVVRARACR